MNCAIKIISKTLMTKISHISRGVTTKASTVKQFSRQRALSSSEIKSNSVGIVSNWK